MPLESSPYQPPRFDPSKASGAPRIPAVWYWYVAYCVAMALLYLACIGGGIALFAFADQLAAEDASSSPLEFQIMGAILAAISVPLTVLFAAAPLLRGKLGWILGIVAIGIGMTSACCLPACIPLLLFWIKPELKAYMRA